MEEVYIRSIAGNMCCDLEWLEVVRLVIMMLLCVRVMSLHQEAAGSWKRVTPETTFERFRGHACAHKGATNAQ